MTDRRAAPARTLGTAHLFAIGMGTTIGAGWIVVTGSWLTQAGPVGAALAFALGAVALTPVALCYADLGARFPQAGGEVVYAREAFGDAVGFAVGWMLLLGYAGICAFEGVALGWLLSVLAPAAAGAPLYTALGTPITGLDAAVVVVGTILFSTLNIQGVREAASLQTAVTAGKLVLGVAFIGVAASGGSLSNIEPAFAHPGEKMAGVLAVLVTLPVWYCGFNALPQALGEARNAPARRRLALLMTGVITSTSLFYIGVIFATAMAAPRAALATAELPVLAAVRMVAGDWGGHAVLLTGLIALVSAWNAALFGASRLLYSMARDGALPAVLGRLHARRGTPVAALLFLGVTTLVGGLLGRGFIEPLIRICALGFAIAFLATTAAALRLGAGSRLRAAAGLLVSGAVVLLSLMPGEAAWSAAAPTLAAFTAWLAIGGSLWLLRSAGRRVTP